MFKSRDWCLLAGALSLCLLAHAEEVDYDDAPRGGLGDQVIPLRARRTQASVTVGGDQGIDCSMLQVPDSDGRASARH